jgi:hypothetical protein
MTDMQQYERIYVMDYRAQADALIVEIDRLISDYGDGNLWWWDKKFLADARTGHVSWKSLLTLEQIHDKLDSYDWDSSNGGY